MNAERLLKTLQSISLTNWNYTFWIVHRIGRAVPFAYSAKRLPTSETLEKRLVKRISTKINWANKIVPYQAEQVELDGEDGKQDDDDGDRMVYATDASGTELPAIVEELDKGPDAPQVEEKEELVGAYGYAVELSDPKDPDNKLLAFRKVSAAWKLQPEGLAERVFWKSRMLVESKEESWFKLDGHFDFLAFEDQIFILDRKHFERGLNLRHGMTLKAEATIKHFIDNNFFVDVSILQEKCLKNMRYLRRLSTVEKRGFYKQPNFLSKLSKVATAEGWDVVFKDGQIVVEDGNIESVLTVLADQRLKSLVTDTTYDADASHQFDGPPKRT